MKYGLIGEKLGHSYSAIIHGELGNREYRLHSLPPEELDAFLRAREFRGLNVTIPYKKAVIPYCDALSASARKIGSVNTLVVDEEGKMTGYNTDYDGFVYSTRMGRVEFNGKKVLILGTGGTSLTARAAVEDLGAREIVSVSRSGAVNYDNVYDQVDVQVIVNTTPVGMYPNNGVKLLDLTRFPQLSGVVDVIYNPLYTVLLLQARDLGIPYANGLPMLVQQAKVAAEKFFAAAIDDSETVRIYKKLAAGVSNIVLVGMPGSGKTSIGQCVAALTGRTFLDADACIVERAGMEIPEIFRQYGEPYFRELESQVLADLGKQGGQVIATGGGAVLREENYSALKQNGRIYQICRSRELLATDGRPLSKSREELARMEQIRAPYYRRFQDVEIQNDNTVEDAARRIMEDFNETVGDQRA